MFKKGLFKKKLAYLKVHKHKLKKDFSRSSHCNAPVTDINS